MLVFCLFLPFDDHLLTNLAHHFLIVTLQVNNAVDPFFFYLNLPLHTRNSVHLLFILLLGLPLLRLLQASLKSQSGTSHISFNTFLTRLSFIILYPLQHAADSCKQFRIVIKFGTTLFNLLGMERAELA